MVGNLSEAMNIFTSLRLQTYEGRNHSYVFLPLRLSEKARELSCVLKNFFHIKQSVM
jgi:hypothetical protein